MKHRTRLISAFVYIILALLGTVATGQGPNGPKDTGTTSRLQAEHTLDSYFAAMNSHDFSQVPFTREVVFRGSLHTEPVRGDSAVRAFLVAVGKGARNVQLEWRVIDGDRACAQYEYQSNAGFAVPAVTCFRFEAGRIAEERAFFDPRPFLTPRVQGNDRSVKDSPPCSTEVRYGQNDAAGHFAVVNGIRLYYETYGSGPPLLLIHGNGGSIWGMRCQIAHFSRSYRVIVADSRAHGKSEDGSGPLTYEQIADDLAALLREVNASSTAVLGQSDGAIVALLLGIRYPSKVNKIVANSPNLWPDETAMAAWVFPLMKQDLERAEAMIAKGDHSKNWVRIKRWNELMLNEPHIQLGELRRIQAPVLISGADEDVIKTEHLLDIYRNLQHAQLSILPGTTHFLTQGQYERFNAMAERFLSNPFTRPTTKQEIEQLEASGQLQP
jgi:Predicted hydrolases or acyltransferases (alpha/beta hydrolase superfamily)